MPSLTHPSPTLTHPIVLPEQEAVLIGDVHQNVDWLEQILEKHRDAKRFILLGDLFDPKYGRPSVDRLTAIQFYQTLVDDPRIILLWGNHDVTAFACWYGYRYFGNARHPGTYAWAIKNTPWADVDFSAVPHLERLWEKFQPLVKLGPWVISHAGIHEGLLPVNPKDTDLIELAHEAHELLWGMRHEDRVPPIWGAGSVRGGNEAIGGIAWQDFYYEFMDSLPWPQIVAHTPGVNPQAIGRSVNIDCSQTKYACTRIGGGLQLLEVKSKSELRQKTA